MHRHPPRRDHEHQVALALAGLARTVVSAPRAGREVPTPELIIRNGLVIDGCGSSGFSAAVVVDGETLTIHRGDTNHLSAAREVDATGRAVCPDFIDLHSHAGLTIFGQPHHDRRCAGRHRGDDHARAAGALSTTPCPLQRRVAR